MPHQPVVIKTSVQENRVRVSGSKQRTNPILDYQAKEKGWDERNKDYQFKNGHLAERKRSAMRRRGLRTTTEMRPAHSLQQKLLGVVVGHSLMSAKSQYHFLFRQRNSGFSVISNDEPVLIGRLLQTTENLSPGKLPLAAKIGTDYALMKSSALRVLGRADLIKRVPVRRKNHVNAIVLCRKRFHLEVSMLRFVKAQNMTLPLFVR